MKTLIHDGNVVYPWGTVQADLLVEDKQIAAIGQNLRHIVKSVDSEIDASGKFVLPGLIDAHVHMPWESDGVSSTDDFASGTRAAIYGGVTTVIDFAIPKEGEGLPAAVRRRVEEANGTSYADFSVHAVVNYFYQRLPEEIAEVVASGVPSFKLYMLYSGLRLNSGEIYQVMKWVKKAGGIIGIHAEDEEIIQTLRGFCKDKDEKFPYCHYLSSPDIVEAAAVEQALRLNQEIGGRLYFVHISAGRSLQLITQAKWHGQIVYAETCPHYLMLTAEEYKRPDGYLFIVSPSLKLARDREALWRGIRDGDVDFISTDHCPFSRSQKQEHKDDFAAVPGGLPGIETRLPVLITEGHHHRGVPLERIVELTSYTPARVFGLFPTKGILQPGSDADLLILDLDKEWILYNQDLHMNVDWSPYEGYRCRGSLELVMLRGEVLYEDNRWIADKPQGKFIPRRIEGGQYVCRR